MITNPQRIRALDRELLLREQRTYAQNLAIFEAMVEHARALGVWPPEDPLEGLEVDIEIARVVNVLKPD